MDEITITKPEQAIDWGEIKSKVEAARHALSPVAVMSAEQRKDILRERAKALAEETEQRESPQVTQDFLVFHLAHETYGIETTFIREVYPLKDLTPLPGVPDFVLGIVNARGKIISVVDLKKFFNLKEKGLGQLNKLIILHTKNLEFGILADEIIGERSIELGEIQTAPPSILGIGADYLRGVTSEHIIILDTEKILSDDKIIVQQDNY